MTAFEAIFLLIQGKAALFMRSSEVECLNMDLHNSVLASQSRLALIGKKGAHAGMLESMLRA
eukprot:1153699-Pelagomonas_calceolata.AAC.14